jgi:hypothetical protein
MGAKKPSFLEVKKAAEWCDRDGGIIGARNGKCTGLATTDSPLGRHGYFFIAMLYAV